MKSSNLKDKIKDLSSSPGVYLYLNSSGEVIYVGKAKNLKRRVSSYFIIKHDLRSKTYALVSKISDLKTIEVSSELEALILEAELIKKYKPIYNIELKDDKSYIYIVIRSEVLNINGDIKSIPKVVTCRKSQINDKDIVFGPFPSSNVVKSLVRNLRRIFPYRDCSIPKFNLYKSKGVPCLYGHIGVCPAPCISFNDKYSQNIKQIKRILEGKSQTLIDDMSKNMKSLSKKQEYEKASEYRDIIEKINYVRQSFRTPDEYMDNPTLIEDLRFKSLEDVKNSLPEFKFINGYPKRIECYDISNISGKEAVGSMVVSIDGKVEKSEYKKFKIKFKDTPDDFEMMYEVLYRRLRHEIDPKLRKWGLPDLIVLDGGKGQISSVLAAVDNLCEDFKLSFLKDIKIIGLAKRYETIVYAKDINTDTNLRKISFIEINLPKDNKGLNLLITLRDEAHRFAQSYHHLLRKKRIRE